MRTNRFDINRMTRSNTGGGGGATGGGGSYTLPLAADGVRGGVQLGYTQTGRNYPVQLDGEKAYVNVPWTDHYAWGDITNKPAQATRWPTFDEVTSKPATATRWPSWSEVTSKPSATGGSTTPVYWNGSGFTTCTPYSQASVNYATSAGNADTVDNYHASGLWRSDGGTWNPQANIEMHANANGCEWSFDMHRGNYTGCIWHVWDEANGSILVVDGATARVGIGTTSPREALDIRGGLVTTGDQTISSDIRMKKVIDFNLPINAEEIAAAPVIHFTLKNDKKQARRIGSVAQYWKKFVPEAVPTGDDGMLSMGYGSIALVSAVALAREVVTLKQEVSKLQKLIRNQEKK